MKSKKLASFVVMLVFISLSCNFLFPTRSNKVTNMPVVDFETAAEPLNVTVRLDEASTVSSTITPTGGSLTLTATDGSLFTLEIPAKALASDTVITMTALKSIAGAPLDDGAMAAVQLEPSGLFFNEVVTLIIIPVQEIPIKNQIIFGYEGTGQDYHLALVDPKSKEIKIRLMEFSGAGVGSGGDAQWAANLQIQATNSSTRIWQKWGELAQKERRGALLVADNDNTEYVDQMVSILDQFYDQVVLKEYAAAELDCQYAQQALDDLIFVERLGQLLGKSQQTTGFAEKALRLGEIGSKCKKAYHISGSLGDLTEDGYACDATKPFTIHGTITMDFTPTDEKSGTFNFSGGPFGDAGSGSYTISNGSMQITGSGCVDSNGTYCNSGEGTLSATPIDPATCPSQ